MLITQKDINDSQAPFILQSPTGDWKLIVNILSAGNQLRLQVIDDHDSELTKRSLELE